MDAMGAGASFGLAEAFPPASWEAWRQAVDGVLAKGLSHPSPEALAEAFEAKLVGRTLEGLRIEPLAIGQAAPAPLGLPGQAPYLRGAKADGAWEIRQGLWVDAQASGLPAQALEELEGGATGLALWLEEAPPLSAEALEAWLKGVVVEAIPVALVAGRRAGEAAAALAGLWEVKGLSPEERQGELGLDPLGAWLQSAGTLELAALQVEAAAWARRALAWPLVRALRVDASLVHEAGGGEVQELAFALSAGLAQLRALTEAGLGLEEACRSLSFAFAASPDQFLTMAKLRAARRLWAALTAACGASEGAQAQVQWAITSRAALTRHEPWANALRHTLAAFAAGVGGAQALTVRPHDALLEPGGSAAGRRLARNTQLLLLEEAHLGQVQDLAGGSHHVEALSEDLAQAAWACFQRWEAAGGAIAALKAGLIQQEVAELRSRREAAIAKRSLAKTGVNEFPNVHEGPLAPEAKRRPPEGPVQPLWPSRHAEPFEDQRGRAEVMALAGRRPRVFLATLGSQAEFTPRATFAKNFFEAGGMEAVGGERAMELTACLEAWAASGAELACLCGTDAAYAEAGPALAQALQGHPRPPKRLYLAGQLKGESGTALRAAGVGGSIHLGCEALALLSEALDLVGAAPLEVCK